MVEIQSEHQLIPLLLILSIIQLNTTISGMILTTKPLGMKRMCVHATSALIMQYLTEFCLNIVDQSTLFCEIQADDIKIEYHPHSNQQICSL